MKVFLFPHTHWDREWYKPFQDYRIRLALVMDGVLKELISGNLEHFYLDGQTIILEDYLELHPEKADEIQDLIKSKKLFISPWYVLADEFLVSGEALVRNLLVGINQAKSFECEDFFGYMPDSFGHNSQMPQILKSFGIKNAVLWRGAGDRKSEFVWKTGEVASVLTTYLTEGYFQDVLYSGMDVNELLDRIKNRAAFGSMLFPIGGDHLGVVKKLKEKIEKLDIPGYKFEQKPVSEYFKELNPTEIEVVEGELRDNSRNPILPGVYSSRMYLKQLNARSTWNLSRLAEPLTVFTEGRKWKNEIDYAWKLLLKNHPHDSICGCSVDEVHEENVSRFKQVNQISKALIDRCLGGIAQKYPAKTLFACNLSNYPFSGVAKFVTDRASIVSQGQFVRKFQAFPRELLLDTQRVPFCEDMKEFSEYLVYVEDLPAFSVNSIKIKSCPDSVKISEKKISNSLVEVSVNPDGAVCLRDLKNGRGFENLHIIQSRQDKGDAYNYSPVVEDRPVKAEFVRSEIAEKGDLRSVLRLTYKLKNTLITTEIAVTACSKRVEFFSEWVNVDKDNIVQLKFNLPEKIMETISEDTFGLIKRDFAPDYRLENHIPAAKGVELRTNSSPMQRFIFAQGLGVITEGLPEYVVSENSLLITLLRSVGKLSKTSLNTRNFPAGPPLDTPDSQCLGKVAARYALCPAEAPQELFKEADEFMESLFLEEGQGGNDDDFGNLVEVSNENILIYAVKVPEDSEVNGIILRCFNISGLPQKVVFKSDLGFSSIVEVNSLEETLNEQSVEEIDFKSGELKSILFRY